MDLVDSDSCGVSDADDTFAANRVENNTSRLQRWKNHRKVVIDDDDDDDGTCSSAASPKETPKIQTKMNELSSLRHKNNGKKEINCSFSDSSNGSFDRLLNNLRIQADDDDDKQSPISYDVDQEEDESLSDSSLSTLQPSVGPPRHLETPNDHSEECGKQTSYTASTVWKRNHQGEYELPHPLPKLCIPASLFGKLYDHQKEGIEFLARLHASGVGGILGDDMGMGKTFMTLALLGGLLRTKTISSALIVAPVSVIHGWEREAKAILSLCTLNNHRINILTSALSISQRRKMMQSTLQKSICITTYGMVRENAEDFIRYSKFDYVVLDEGHTIKNENSQISQACRKICFRKSTHRLILTGTPIMNNLRDLWALFDFATNGKVLGDRKHFLANFANPIEAARDVNATKATITAGEKANQMLQEKLKPYFLQRLKADVLADQLPPKTELIVWTHLSEKQRQLYSEFVRENSLIRNLLLGQEKSPLIAITYLKKLCGHPLLFHTTNATNFEKAADAASFENSLEKMKLSDLMDQSAKLQVLWDLVKRLLAHEHKILIFSQSTRVLDIIEKVLRQSSSASTNVSSSLARIDGGTPEYERQRIVNEFNSDSQRSYKRIDVLLLSTKAAGVGLTLNAADRVIIFDPSWSPAEDAQAVDRCYRIGQTSPVIVYRLIAAGSVEEKMYEKQIYKDGIRRTVLDNLGLSKTDDSSQDVRQRLEIQRYFDASELKKLFELGDPGVCKVMEKLQENLTADEIEEDWGSHDFILSHPKVVGLSRHDGFYNRANVVSERNEENPSHTGSDQTPILIDLTENEQTHIGKRSQKSVENSSPLLNLLDDDANATRSKFFLANLNSKNLGKEQLESVDAHKGKTFVDESDESENEEPIETKESCSVGSNIEFIRSKSTHHDTSGINDSRPSTVSEELERVHKYVSRGQQRRAFQILVELLQYRKMEISGLQEEKIHQTIVHLANSMELKLLTPVHSNSP